MNLIWKTLIAIVAFVAASLAAAVLLYDGFLYFAMNGDPHYRAIDSCMDSGGCCDYQDKICRKDEPDAQRLCDRSKP